jgi:hypothetical protein
VFFGKLKEKNGETVILQDARNCLYWSAETRGFLGLTTTGPQEGSRIGPAASEIELFGVTSITKCTPEAVEAWGSLKWK